VWPLPRSRRRNRAGGRGGRTRRGGRGGSWRRGDEQRREKPTFSLGLHANEWLAALCSSLCGYCGTGYSTVCVCKMKIPRLQKPLETV
jgi:hypothetical protein